MCSNDTGAAANVTIGVQQEFSPAGHLLGGGTITSPQFSEVGLSERPAAMQHGVRVVQPATAPAAPTATTNGVAARQEHSTSTHTQQHGAEPAAAGSTSTPAQAGKPQVVSPSGVQVRASACRMHLTWLGCTRLLS
jgi:cell division septation protein DedD